MFHFVFYCFLLYYHWRWKKFPKSFCLLIFKFMCYLLSQWWIYYLMTNLSIKSIKIWERARQILLEMVIGRNHFDDCVSSKKTTLSARLSKFTVKTESHLWKHFLKLNSIKLSPLLKKVIKVCVLYFYIFLQKVARKKLWKKILKTVFTHKILTFSRVLIPLFPQSAIAELMNLIEDKS